MKKTLLTEAFTKGVENIRKVHRQGRLIRVSHKITKLQCHMTPKTVSAPMENKKEEVLYKSAILVFFPLLKQNNSSQT